jgi:hypothetical protein
LKQNEIISNRIVKISSVACIVACISDFVVLFLLGSYYPGYSQLKNTMSSLGASISPVSDLISIWWIFIGLLFIFFGVGVNYAFKASGKTAIHAAFLIILYGVGEGIGSGAFKANYIGDTLTTSAIIHDALGGIGEMAILILPLFMRKIIPRKELPWFSTFSMLTFFIGIYLLFMFVLKFSISYHGLWQRLLMLNSYIYLTIIAILMYKKPGKFRWDGFQQVINNSCR